MARSAQARESLIELKYQLDAVDLKRRDEVDQQIAETHTKLVEAEEALVKASDRLQRTVIRSPVRGTVLNVRFKTARGVVRNGETIMDLVPLGDKLIINANVEPKNIDEVRIGQDAHVVFPSYSQRALHRIEAKVIDISADALHDEKNNTRHYLARVEVGREHMAKVAPQIELQAGLPVEVYIATSERTLMEYLLQPLRFVIERSMRES
jgi:HlyD family type I secretion membrane fusion protein